MTLETWQFAVCDWKPHHLHAAQGAGAEVVVPTNRDPYEWVPRASCALPPLERTAVCALLSGLRVVLVGDSTLAMVFHSLALALRARTQMDTSGGRRVAHVACGPHAAPVTVVSLRNDLLLQDTPQDKKVVRSHRLEWFRKAPWLKEGGNLAILGAGLHDVGSDSSDKIEPGFYARHLAAAIRSSGPNRTAAVAIAAPQPGCSRFTAPLPLSRARLLANNASAADSPYLAQWRVWAQRPALMRSVALANGASFLDLTSMTITRPDRALGRFKTWMVDKASKKDVPIPARARDCVHFCLPGPTDTLARVLIAWAAERAREGGVLT